MDIDMELFEGFTKIAEVMGKSITEDEVCVPRDTIGIPYRKSFDARFTHYPWRIRHAFNRAYQIVAVHEATSPPDFP